MKEDKTWCTQTEAEVNQETHASDFSQLLLAKAHCSG